MDKIGVPFNGKKQICRAMLMTDDYIFNPNELKSEMSDKGWLKAKDARVTPTQSPINTAA